MKPRSKRTISTSSSKTKKHRGRGRGRAQRRVRKNNNNNPHETNNQDPSSINNKDQEHRGNSSRSLLQKCTVSHPLQDGYVYVPKGDPYVTRHCKARSKDADKTIYIVYDPSFRRQLGIRIPIDIHKSVLLTASLTASNRASATQLRDARDSIKAERLLNTTFPCIPSPCRTKILQHAFEKGSGRVGRISTRSDLQKATLAVEAHIRHEHTPYEKMLRDGISDRDEARELVWSAVQRIRDEWAGKKPDRPITDDKAEIEVIDLT